MESGATAHNISSFCLLPNCTIGLFVETNLVRNKVTKIKSVAILYRQPRGIEASETQVDIIRYARNNY